MEELGAETSSFLKHHRKCGRRVACFREPIAIDGSLKGVSGRGAACGWAFEHLDYNKEEEPWYTTPDTMLAEWEVQRTITMAELGGFHHGFVVSAGTSHNSHRSHGTRRGKEGCIGPTHKDADLLIIVRD